MQDFPSNSQKAQATDAPREKPKPVTSAETRDRKRGLGRQFRETFFAGSSREAFGYMAEEVVVPSLRDMFAESMHSLVDRVIYGPGSGGGRRRSAASSPNTATGHVNYGGYSQPSQPAQQQRTITRRSRAVHDFQDLVIPNRADAAEVLDNMYEWLERFGRVSVADLYSLVGVRPEHTDEKWGWTSLRGARAVRLPRDAGYMLDLPELQPL